MCIIAVDFDGTISADFDRAREALQSLKDAGHTIVVWSSRNSLAQHGDESEPLMTQMIDELQEHRIPYDDIDYGDVGKFHAQVYIDDKAFRFEDNWDEIVSRIY